MKRAIQVALVIFAAAAMVSGAAWAYMGMPKTPVEFYLGHTHDESGETHGAPSHSGGTDAYGCHNASVPYHCH